jgi:hypothetical protein
MIQMSWSPVAAVDVVEVFVAIVVVVVGDHLVGLALEAHALVASTAGHPVAAVDSDYRDLALFVGALPNPVFFHVLLEGLVAPLSSLLAGDPGVVTALALQAVGGQTDIALDMIGLYHVYLLASSSETESHHVCMLGQVLVGCHRHDLSPLISLEN